MTTLTLYARDALALREAIHNRLQMVGGDQEPVPAPGWAALEVVRLIDRETDYGTIDSGDIELDLSAEQVAVAADLARRTFEDTVDGSRKGEAGVLARALHALNAHPAVPAATPGR